MSRAAVRSAGSAAPCPLTLRLVTPTPAVELLEHIGGTQLSLRSISRQLYKVINQTVEQ